MMLMIPAGGTPSATTVARMTKYDESLTRAGVLLALDQLHPSAKGARVSFAGGRARATEEPKHPVGGYWLIQVKSKEEAIEWASRCPAQDGDVIEVRQVQETSEQ